MNYLAHLYLADDTGTSLAGSVLGDAVKGRLRGAYPPRIEQGIRLHRRIDTFTDSHPVVMAACKRFAAPYRRYAGILLDIYFDYLLSRHWARLHTQTLAQFAHRVARDIWHEWPHEPLTAQRMQGFPDVLLSYGRLSGVATALHRVGTRAKRANPIADGLPLLQAQHDLLAADFEALFSDLREFVRREAPRCIGSDPKAV